MKYLAKVLPGEGNWIIPTKNPNLRPKKVEKNWDNKHVKEHYGTVKGKIFLCTREIGKGDEVINLVDYSKLIWPGLKDAKAPINPVKVIGEISQEAVWIEEDDQFNEDQIWRQILVKDYLGEDDYTELNTVTLKGYDIIGDGTKYGDKLVAIYPIKIKCPTCNTFH